MPSIAVDRETWKGGGSKDCRSPALENTVYTISKGLLEMYPTYNHAYAQKAASE